MGDYYGVKCVKEKGVSVSSYSALKGNVYLSDGEHLIAIMNNGLYSVATDVTNPSELQYFDSSYNQGFWLSMSIYKVNEDILGECPDQGRDYSDDFGF